MLGQKEYNIMAELILEPSLPPKLTPISCKAISMIPLYMISIVSDCLSRDLLAYGFDDLSFRHVL